MMMAQFLRLLDELLELDPGTLTGREELAQLERWDSLAVIGFIALLDQHFAMSVSAAEILNCRTVSDLAALTKGKVQP